jgi:hypothetical protein
MKMEALLLNADCLAECSSKYSLTCIKWSARGLSQNDRYGQGTTVSRIQIDSYCYICFDKIWLYMDVFF